MDPEEILAQIRETERTMVREMVNQVKNPILGIQQPSVAMYGRTDILEGYWRLLSDCQYDIEEGLRLLKAACDWHLVVRPRMKELIPKVYTEKPGLFSLRQIGFDGDGRPVLYHCFAQDQATVSDWTVDAILTHVVQIIENAGRCSRHKEGEERGMTMKLIIDCSGFTSAPFKSYDHINKLHQTLMLLYPNVLDCVAIVNYSHEARVIWSGISDVMDDSLQAKIKFTPLKELDEHIAPVSHDLLSWLTVEIEENRNGDLSPRQLAFWKAPTGSGHDPRGANKFVADFITKKASPHGFENHPGIVYGN